MAVIAPMKTEEVAAQALKRAAERLTPDFRQDALTAGWPADIVFQMTVEENDGDLYLSYPDSIAGKVETLEYGNESQSPNPVIRRFIRNHTDGIQDIFESAFEDVASELGAFN
jgi:hypothetical protein